MTQPSEWDTMDTLPPFSSNSGLREQKSEYSLFSSCVRPLVICMGRWRGRVEEEDGDTLPFRRRVRGPHLVPVKGTVVVHDVHRAAVEQISQPSDFVRSYRLHRVCAGEPTHLLTRYQKNNTTDTLVWWSPIQLCISQKHWSRMDFIWECMEDFRWSLLLSSICVFIGRISRINIGSGQPKYYLMLSCPHVEKMKLRMSTFIFDLLWYIMIENTVFTLVRNDNYGLTL